MEATTRRKFLTITGIIIAGFLVLFTALHFWFSHNAEEILERIVYSKSGGKMKLNVKRFSFNYFTYYIELKKASLISTDSTRPATYRIELGKLSLKVVSFLPLLYKKQLLIDSIKLYNPEITVYRWRADTTLKSKSDASLSEEMGRVYKSMLDVLDAFGLKRIHIDNGSFHLVNKMKPGAEPVTVSNIYFNLLRMADDTTKSISYIPQKQDILFRTFNQNIALPGGRHHLAFKNLRMQLHQQRLEMDSCTITARAIDSTQSKYSLFFDKLMLVNVDFDALYRYNLIKADSVYCINPRFNIDIVSPEKKEKTATQKKEAIPDPEKMLQELTGDLQLAFVGVKDAGIHINISGSRNRSLFNSNKDDFEIRGLRIHSGSSKPVVIDRFDMLVRDYRLYNEDSSSAYAFDSIHFFNNKMALSNFSVVTVPSKDRLRAERDFKIPYFELVGLNWSTLLFDQSLNAREATLYNPVIYYKGIPQKKARRRLGMFQLLRSLDSLMTLRKLTVINGQVNVQINPSIRFTLDNASIILNSNEFLQSKNSAGLKGSLNLLKFSKGDVHLKDITARMADVSYTGENQLHAQKLTVSNTSKTIQATAGDVRMADLVVDEGTDALVLEGISWGNARVSLQNTVPVPGKSKTGSSISIRNLSGKNTDFIFAGDGLKLSAFFNNINADSIEKKGHDPLIINNLQADGRELVLARKALTVHAGSFALKDKAASSLHDVLIRKEQPMDSMNIAASSIMFTPDFNAILKNDLHFSSVQLQSPSINISKRATGGAKPAKENMPVLNIDHLTASQPSIQLSLYKYDSATSIHLPQSKGGLIELDDLRTGKDGLTIGSFRLKNNTFLFTKPTGKTVGVEKGTVDVHVKDLHVNNVDGKPVWKALVQSLEVRQPKEMVIVGKKNSRFSFELGSLGNLQLSSEFSTDVTKMLRSNLAVWIKTKNGQYVDSTTTLKWFDSKYDAREKKLTLDSFVYRPTLSRDSFVAARKYRMDYRTFNTGRIELTGFDLEKYTKDSSFQADVLTIHQPLISIYLDKGLPRREGIIKPLPADMIQSIPFPVQLNKVQLVQGNLVYTEMSEKKKTEATITLHKLNATLVNIKNRFIKDTDSLSLRMDSYLMDSAKISLRVKQSYTDSLKSFRMVLRANPTTLSFLNPFLVPLASVKIASGTIDSLHLRAIGNEYISMGEMAMFYHDLRIQILKDADTAKTTFLTRTASYLVNTFVLKKNNDGRMGFVYYERPRDRSFFYYLVQMTLRGMTTSIGVKKNKKQMQRYQKQLDRQNLPPIDLDL